MPLTREHVSTARSLLFVPGSRPDRFSKAVASGADAVVVDLEDAVAPADKAVARDAVTTWLEAGARAVVRINGTGTPWHDDDIAALAARAGHPVIVLLPMVTCPDEIAAVLARLPTGSGVLPVIETAAAVLDTRALCVVPGVVRCVFGNGDLAAQLGVEHDDLQALAHARSAVVLGSAAAHVSAPLDGVTTALDDESVLRRDTIHARRLGFTGKLCIHPRQVPVVHDVFTPTNEDIARAERIVAAEGAVTTVDGRMIDAPIVARARALLERPRSHRQLAHREPAHREKEDQ